MTRRLAAFLLVVIGVTGLLVGLWLLGPFMTLGNGPAATLIPVGIAVYGLAATLAGLGVFVRRRWGWRLAVVTIGIGLVELVWQTTLLGLDPVTLFGVGLWGLVLVLLLASDTRQTA